MSDGTNGNAADAGNAGASGGANGASGDVTIESLQAELTTSKEAAANYKAMHEETFNKFTGLESAFKKVSAEAKDYRLKVKDLKNGKGAEGNDDDRIKAAVESVKAEFGEKLTAKNERIDFLYKDVKDTKIGNVISREALKLGVRPQVLKLIQTELSGRITLDESTLQPIVVQENGQSAFKGGIPMTIPQLVKDYCEIPDNKFLFPANPNTGSGGNGGRQSSGGATFTRSGIKAMSTAEYAKNQDAIRKAAAAGKIAD